MPSLRDLLRSLDPEGSVRGGAIVGEDGLVIHSALNPEADDEAIAALAVTTRRHAEQLGGASGSGTLETAVFEFGLGPAILTSLTPHATLVVLAKPDRDLGRLLYALRVERAALAALV